MPVSSTQISGLVGGQTAMFHNQAVAAQNVSSAYGMGPVGGQQAQPMSNPFPAESVGPTYSQSGWKNWNYSPDAGARMAGGVGMAIPAAASVASMAGLVAGGRAAYLDPFSGVASAFRRGTGLARGAGMQGTLGHIGQAFRVGGLRAGAGVLGGGLAAGAAAAVPYWLAGKAISTVGENIYAGAQDVQQVGQMARQYMDPVWGQAGARRGGQRGRGQIRNMVNVLRDIAGEDVMADMESLKRIMDQAGRSGMLGGVQDVGQFRKRFRQIVDRTKAVAKAMGTSLEEAMPLMRQMGQMGMWTSRDIMGTTRAIQAAGPAATPHLMGAMQAGAQQSMQMGGTARAGAVMGRELFRTMQLAQRSGAVSREQMFEFTGGATGAEGQRIAAQRMSGIMQRFGQTSMGQLMLAGLGETQENRRGQQVFTGRIDPRKLEQFQRGELSVGRLQQMGQRVTQGSREAAASFMFNRERMGQEMLSQGGVETMNAALQRVLEKAMPNAGENVRKMLSRKILGVSSRDVEMISKLADEQGRIRDQDARENERVINEQMRRLEERQFRSWQGVSDILKQSWEQTVQPIRDFGVDLATSWGEATDRIIDRITGRTKQIAMGSEERVRMFRQSMRQQASRAVAGGIETAAGAPGGAAARPAGPTNMLQMLEMTPEQRETFRETVGRTAPEAGGARPDVEAGTGVTTEEGLRAVTPEQAGGARVGQRWFLPGDVRERFTAGGMLGGLTSAMTAVAGQYRGSRAEAVQRLGVSPIAKVSDPSTVGGRGFVVAPASGGGGFEVYRVKRIQQAMEQAHKRAKAPTLRNLLGKDADTDENRSRITTIQTAMRALQLDPKRSKYLKELRESGQIDTYNRELAREIAKRSGGNVAEAFRGLGADLSRDPGDNDAVRNIIQIATEQGEGVSDLVLEEKEALEALGQMSPRQVDEEQQDNIRRMQEALSGEVMVQKVSPFRGAYTAKETVEGGGAELSDDELTDVVTKYGSSLDKFVSDMAQGKKPDPKSKFVVAATKFGADPAAKRLMEYFQRAPADAAAAFLGKIGRQEGGMREFVGLRMHRAEQESLERIRKVAKGQADISEDLSADTRERLKDIQTSLTTVRSGEEYKAIMGDVETLAGKLSPEEIRMLARGEGGTFGRQAAAIARTDEIQAMSGAKFEDVRKRVSAAVGVKDISQLMTPEQRQDLSKALEDKKIDEGEAKDLQASFKEAIKLAVGETAKDKDEINKQMISSMQAYTKANTAFVQVAGDALAKVGGVDPEVVKSALDQVSTTNWVEKGTST